MLEIIWIVDIIISAALILGGIFMAKSVPSEPNEAVGFRTELAMTGRKAWMTANKTAAKIWLIGGICMLAASVVVLYLLNAFVSEKAAVIGAVICLLWGFAVVLLSVWKVGIVLKKLVTEDNNNSDE